MTIIEHHVVRKGSILLLGIAVDNAVLDIVTSEAELRECLRLLRQPCRALVRPRIGTFGIYSVALNLEDDRTASIFVDGPDFEQYRTQSAAIWLGKAELCRVLEEVLEVNENENPMSLTHD